MGGEVGEMFGDWRSKVTGIVPKKSNFAPESTVSPQNHVAFGVLSFLTRLAQVAHLVLTK
jgi:hypothetical protein